MRRSFKQFVDFENGFVTNRIRPLSGRSDRMDSSKVEAYRNPSFMEEDRRDKPQYLQELKRE